MKKSDLSLRKSPKQSRSQTVVDSILTATARIFSKNGNDLTSTNKIAEVAGVSVGSLYQYFPNKESIFSQLIEQEQSAIHQQVIEKLDQFKNEDLTRAIPELVAFVVGHFFEKRALIPNLIAQAFRLQITTLAVDRRQKIIEAVSEFLFHHQDQMAKGTDFQSKAYVLSHALIGVLEIASLQGFKATDRSNLERELTQLIIGYLFYEPTQ